MNRKRWNLKNYYGRKKGKGMWTKPERIVWDILRNQLNVSFAYQYPIKCIDEDGREWMFTVDFLVFPDIVIEVDGDRVHGSKRQMNKMRWRDSLLMKKGYKVYHFWQSDIEADPVYVKRRIQDILDYYGYR